MEQGPTAKQTLRVWPSEEYETDRVEQVHGNADPSVRGGGKEGRQSSGVRELEIA